MGILDNLIGKNKKSSNTRVMSQETSRVIFTGIQTKGFRGFKNVNMVRYHGENDKVCFDNAIKLQQKYGDEFIGSEIKFILFEGGSNNRIIVECDGLFVGTIYPTNQYYNIIKAGKFDKAYARADVETIITGDNKNKVETRTKAGLLINLIAD